MEEKKRKTSKISIYGFSSYVDYIFCVSTFFLKYFKFRNHIIKQRKYQNLKPISKSVSVNLNISEDTPMSSLQKTK